MYGKRLKALRKEHHWRIDDVAQKLEVPRSTYAAYETKHRKPPIETLTKLAKLYGVSTDYLLGLTQEKDIKELEYDLSKYLKKEDLNWDGVPISDEELKPIRDLFEVVIRDRIPNKKINK